MGRPYQTELHEILATLDWAASAELRGLRRAIAAASALPLVAVGSGGSLTAAHLLAAMHRRLCGQHASVLTPLEARGRINSAASVWLLSAGGTNVDILSAFAGLVRGEPEQMAVLCGRKGSPLWLAAAAHQFVDLVDAEGPSGKDGFLATNSLVAACVLLCRGFGEVCQSPVDLRELRSFSKGLAGRVGRPAPWKRRAAELWSRQTVVVLHGPTTSAAAIDLESKFTEAALGNIQIADYRNFAHGRHHWLAKHGDTSSVIAFMTEEDRELAAKTLALLPADIPLARFDLEGNFLQAALKGIVTALHLVGWAGEQRRIDPGRPGVPKFGRLLFHLSVPRARSVRSSKIADSDCAAIERKAGVSIDQLEARGDIDQWQRALTSFKRRLLRGRYVGIVFDYDGTLVDARERSAPPRAEIATELVRLLSDGLVIGIATGRGASVRRDLRQCLPEPLWPRVCVGYYNGSDVASLDRDSVPTGTPNPCDDLVVVAKELEAHWGLKTSASVTLRPRQITIESTRPGLGDMLWDIATQVVQTNGSRDVSVVRSRHSVDVLAPGVSKTAVLDLLRASFRVSGDVLRIGDQGRLPGNDHALLAAPHSISVDRVSVDPTTCWNLAPRGYRGIQLTTAYCRSLHRRSDGTWRLAMPSWRAL